MKAAILTKQGDPTVLSIRDDYPKPQIAEGHEVLIKVKAIGEYCDPSSTQESPEGLVALSRKLSTSS